MLGKIADYISDAMVKNQIIDASEKPFYKYALYLRIEVMVGYFLLATIALVFRKFCDSIIYVTTFSVIRKKSGGFHFSTPLACFTFSACSCLVSILFLDELFNV